MCPFFAAAGSGGREVSLFPSVPSVLSLLSLLPFLPEEMKRAGIRGRKGDFSVIFYCVQCIVRYSCIFAMLTLQHTRGTSEIPAEASFCPPCTSQSAGSSVTLLIAQVCVVLVGICQYNQIR